MRHKIAIILAFSLLAGLLPAGCGSAGERAVVKEEAAQIERAHLDGREAARAFVGRKFKDSLEIQEAMVNAGVKRAQYDSLPKCREAYDSAFFQTIRTVRPEIERDVRKLGN